MELFETLQSFTKVVEFLTGELNEFITWKF